MTPDTPLVSVVVPFFDAEDHLVRCLDSLAAQTLDSIEIVLVDDGSTDGSSAMAEDFRDRHPDRVVLVTKPNGGRADARNRGVATASGRYVGFVDSDDWAEPEMYETLVERALETGADVVVADYAALGPNETTPHTVHEGDASEYGRTLAENPRLFSLCMGSLCNKLFSRHLFGPGDLFPSGLDFEDLATVYVLLARAALIERVDGPPLYHYIQGGPSSIMAACDDRYLDLVGALKYMDAKFRDMDQFERFRDELLRVNLLHLIFARYSDLFRYSPGVTSNRFIERAFAHLDRDFPDWREAPIAEMFATNRAYAFVSTRKPLLKAYIAVLAAVRDSR